VKGQNGGKNLKKTHPGIARERGNGFRSVTVFKVKIPDRTKKVNFIKKSAELLQKVRVTNERQRNEEKIKGEGGRPEGGTSQKKTGK